MVPFLALRHAQAQPAQLVAQQEAAQTQLVAQPPRPQPVPPPPQLQALTQVLQ